MRFARGARPFITSCESRTWMANKIKRTLLSPHPDQYSTVKIRLPSCTGAPPTLRHLISTVALPTFEKDATHWNETSEYSSPASALAQVMTPGSALILTALWRSPLSSRSLRPPELWFPPIG